MNRRRRNPLACAANLYLGGLACDAWLLAAEPNQSLFQRLSPRQRAVAVGGLILIVLLGCVMVILAWLGARFTRRYISRPAPRPRSDPAGDDWARKPLLDDEE